MEKKIQLHKNNIFNQIGHGSESERIFLENMTQNEKIDPVTGEAFYYKCPVQKTKKGYRVTIPLEESRLLEADFVKVVMSRDKDNYLVIKPFGKQ